MRDGVKDLESSTFIIKTSKKNIEFDMSTVQYVTDADLIDVSTLHPTSSCAIGGRSGMSGCNIIPMRLKSGA